MVKHMAMTALVAGATLMGVAGCDSAPEGTTDDTTSAATGTGGTAVTTTAAGGASGVGGSGGAGGAGGQVSRPALIDFRIGPYGSAAEILDGSIDVALAAYDTSDVYSHSAAQGYTLQAVGAWLDVSLTQEIPGGDARRQQLLSAALDEVDQLAAAADRVTSGGPAFGLDISFDAFGDASTNPPFTAYTWQSGMVSLGIAEVLRYAADNPELHLEEASRLEAARVFLGQLLDYWTSHFTTVTLGAQDGGFFWYSDRSVDAKAVHNTSLLIAMASTIYSDLVGDPAYEERAAAAARLLAARWSTTSEGGYTWNYCDDGLPPAQRGPEDVSHALVTTQFIRFAQRRGWYGPSDTAKLAQTFLAQMWSGDPARLHGHVDGSSGGTNEWSWTRASVVGMAVQGDAPEGDPALFDFTRSVLFSSYMTRFDRPLMGATVGAPQMLALARLFQHRPDAFADEAPPPLVAGPDDTTPRIEGARFYTVDWDPPAPMAFGGLTLEARSAQTINANLVVDLPDGDTSDAVLSVTYAASNGGTIQQWDGTQYHALAPLTRSAADDDQVRWMRTTVRLRPDRFDYQPTISGTNVLLQVTNTPAVHAVELTRLP